MLVLIRRNETLLTSLEEERPDALEVAKEAHAQGEAQAETGGEVATARLFL